MHTETREGFFGGVLSACVRHWGLVLAASVLLLVAGVASFLRIPIDAVPDITNVQVQINAEAPGFTPLEVESRVTFPLETQLAGIPGLESTRSLSRYGLSQITAVFEEGTDIYFARQQIGERLVEAREAIPEGVQASMGPISTGLGEVFFYTLEPDTNAVRPITDPGELKTIHDWVVKPQLRRLKGVAEVNATGGKDQIVQVIPDPARMAARRLSFEILLDAIRRNVQNVGAGYVERGGEQVLVRFPGQPAAISDLEDLVVSHHEGAPIRLSEVASVAWGAQLPTGAATAGGKEVVLGTVVMLKGANSREVAEASAAAMEKIRPSLPAGVLLTTVYDRTRLVERTIGTVEKSLLEGALLVVVVLFLLLGNLRAALITALVIPLSMAATLIGMQRFGISANLMSLGALDFGLIVDGAVILVENYVRLLAQRQHGGTILDLGQRQQLVRDSSREVRRSTLFGVGIITAVYLPILALEGVEGKMFHPMAWTVILALLAALTLSLTVIPALLPLWVRGKVAEKDSWLLAPFARAYVPSLGMALRRPAMVVGGATIALLGAIFLATRMGGEFIPGLDEGDIALHAMRIPGTSVSQSIAMQIPIEKELLRIPEVDKVFSRIGTSDIATDPMPPNVADQYVMLKAREEWPDPDRPKADLVKEMQTRLAKFPGNNYEFTQPIQMRFNELISGVRSDVAVKVFGDDLDSLLEAAAGIAAVLRDMPGAADVKVEQITGLPLLTVVPDREALARHGMTIEEVQQVVRTAVGGAEAADLFQGDRRFPITVRLGDDVRSDFEQLERLPVPDPHGGAEAFVPLGEIVRFEVADGAAQISRENGKRRVVVTANVRGTDIASFVAQAQTKIAAETKVPAGYWLEWGGTFENLQSATRRLQIVVPVALLLVLGMLYMAVGSVRDSLLVFTGIPLALTGGIAALWLRDTPFSISAGVGFIALSGIAVLNGLVLLTSIRENTRHMPLDEAIRLGCQTRLRPVLMTALVASLGFVPMALAQGAGAEVQRPLATVVIGGVLSSTLLTLLVLPVLVKLSARWRG
jgi:cobalt-zinc-cadmium resistance protein CzcA